MDKVQAQRLANVSNALLDANDNKLAFNMGRYGDVKWKDDGSQDTCGTPACSIGHYAARGDLQKVFTLNKDGDIAMKDKNVEEIAMGHRDQRVLDHFGINIAEANELFEASGCGDADTAIQAAAYIDGFLEDRGWILS